MKLKIRLTIKFHYKYIIVIPDAPVSPVVTCQTQKRPQKKKKKKMDRKVIQISKILFRMKSD